MCRPLAAFLTVQDWLSGAELDLSSRVASVKFSPARFTVPAGGKTQVTVTITPPSGLNPKTVPVYTGFLECASSSLVL